MDPEGHIYDKLLSYLPSGEKQNTSAREGGGIFYTY
jgi:hypothetical protein